MTAGGIAHARVPRADNPSAMAICVWVAHAHLSVKRAIAEEGKR